MYFSPQLSHLEPFSSIILERRQKSLRPISPELGNSHQNYLDWQEALQVRGKICILGFGVNCAFNIFGLLVIQATVVELHNDNRTNPKPSACPSRRSHSPLRSAPIKNLPTRPQSKGMDWRAARFVRAPLGTGSIYRDRCTAGGPIPQYKQYV